MIQLSTYGLVWLTKQSVGVNEVIIGIGIILFVVTGLILIPFQISKRLRSQRFAFRNKGYFEKYEKI